MSREAYAWQEGGKWRLSVMPIDKTHAPGKPRPYNQYETQAELVTEAGKRGLQLVWEDAGTN